MMTTGCHYETLFYQPTVGQAFHIFYDVDHIGFEHQSWKQAIEDLPSLPAESIPSTEVSQRRVHLAPLKIDPVQDAFYHRRYFVSFHLVRLLFGEVD
jgi:hypothetical protein